MLAKPGAKMTIKNRAEKIRALEQKKQNILKEIEDIDRKILSILLLTYNMLGLKVKL